MFFSTRPHTKPTLSFFTLSENKTSQSKSDEEGEKEEMDCAEDEKYLAKLTKEREWDDWKDGWCMQRILLVNARNKMVYDYLAFF